MSPSNLNIGFVRQGNVRFAYCVFEFEVPCSFLNKMKVSYKSVTTALYARIISMNNSFQIKFGGTVDKLDLPPFKDRS